MPSRSSASARPRWTARGGARLPERRVRERRLASERARGRCRHMDRQQESRQARRPCGASAQSGKPRAGQGRERRSRSARDRTRAAIEDRRTFSGDDGAEVGREYEDERREVDAGPGWFFSGAIAPTGARLPRANERSSRTVKSRAPPSPADRRERPEAREATSGARLPEVRDDARPDRIPGEHRARRRFRGIA